MLSFWDSPWYAVLENACHSSSYHFSDLPFIVSEQRTVPSRSFDLTYSAQYDSQGRLKPYDPEVVGQKSSEADVVSVVFVVLLGDTDSDIVVPDLFECLQGQGKSFRGARGWRLEKSEGHSAGSPLT